MQLIVDGEFVEDPWTQPGEDPDASAPGAARNGAASGDGARMIVSLDELARFDFARGGNGRCIRVGVRIDCATGSGLIEPVVTRLDLVAIAFESATDGRGFSLAFRLRRRGFTGELRASGPIVVDQYAFALACGFDSVEIPRALARRQPAALWRHARREIGHAYQSGYRGAAGVFEARHASRDQRVVAHPRAETPIGVVARRCEARPGV